MKLFSTTKKQRYLDKGFSLVEIVVAMGLMAILLPALLTGFVASREGKPQRENKTHAAGLLDEAEEALRSVREKGWINVQTGGLFHPVVSGAVWSLTSGTEIIDTFYTRQILIEDIQRDTNGDIVSSGGVQDPSTKKATITVAWTQPKSDFLQTIVYLTRFGQNTPVTQTTQSDFLSGTTNNVNIVGTGDGAVELVTPTQNLSYTDTYTNSGDYTFDSNKIEFVGGQAQLKATVGTGGTSQNPGITSTLTPWTAVSYGNTPAATLSRQASGGNPGPYARIAWGNSNNTIKQTYMYQAFTVGTGSSATLNFDKRVVSYSGAPDDLRIRVYIDTTLAGTAPTNLVWDSGSLTSTTAWSSTLNLNVSSFIPTAGTYYLKVGGYVNFPGTNRNYQIGFDNVQITWSGSTSYPSDDPTVTWASSTAPSGLIAWSGFSAVETTNGGSIEYQLSNDNGATWLYHNGSIWTTASSTQYNTASEINSAIATFPIGNNSIRVRAFLISDGSQLVKLDSVTLNYTAGSGSSSGNFTSSSIDAGAQASFNRITWNDSNTANTTTEFQIATNNDNSTWNYVGPDGTASTYFTNNEGTINLANVLGRYFRYKVYFTTSNSDLPNVSEVVVNYSP